MIPQRIAPIVMVLETIIQSLTSIGHVSLVLKLRHGIGESVKKIFFFAAGIWRRAGASGATLIDRKHCWQCFPAIF